MTPRSAPGRHQGTSRWPSVVAPGIIVEVATQLARLPFRRSPDRLVGGVCAGIAEWLGVDPLLVRLAAVLLAFTPGVGLVAYVAAWWLVPLDPRPPSTPVEDRPPWLQALQRDEPRTIAGFACLGFGALLLVQSADVAGGLAVLAAALIVTGVGVAWVRTTPEDRYRFRDVVGRAPGSPATLLRGGPGSLVRLGLGVVLVVAGGITLIASAGGFEGASTVLLAAVVSVGGLGVLMGPWALGVLRLAGEERRQRIRSEERAELAAQLHDSVLQTLALIQRSAPTRPADAVALARRQERELRAWLYGEGPARDASTLASALTTVAEEIEADHSVEVELVTVGDHPLDAPALALLAAAREALVNAAKHSGASTVDCYAEVAEGKAGVYVRDRGRGFDPAAVPADRRGIAQSITARLTRVGGTALVTSTPGEGTEVAMEVTLT